jgi:23S rRNA (adenine2503-C2)-methyltransferase
MRDIKDYSLEELKTFIVKNNFPRFYAQQIFSWLYKKRVENFDLMTDISKKGREFLKSNFYFSQLKLLKRKTSCDGTEKFLFGLEDNNCIETVVIPEKERNTLCISTQVGCKFSCKFCLSGKDGFKRNLETSEIVNQFLMVSDTISPSKITNIVFMGIGEPLDNFYATVKAIEIFTQPEGIYFGRRRICISTCGLVPQIKKLKDLNLGVKLSISLHSADDKIRNRIMPINKKYPLKDLIKVVKEVAKKERFPITFEYILIKGINIDKNSAEQLAKLLKGINCKINLIPFNEINSEFQSPTNKEINEFKNELKKRGIFFTLRKSRGKDIEAACGQLRFSFLYEE